MSRIFASALLFLMLGISLGRDASDTYGELELSLTAAEYEGIIQRYLKSHTPSIATFLKILALFIFPCDGLRLKVFPQLHRRSQSLNSQTKCNTGISLRVAMGKRYDQLDLDDPAHA